MNLNEQAAEYANSISKNDTYRQYLSNAFIAGHAAANEWHDASKKLPDLLPGKDYSVNVLAVVEGMKDLQVMCFTLIENVYVWGNCYGDIKGDGEYDDEYNVLLWREIPQPPTK